jgi:hypothetical protein
MTQTSTITSIKREFNLSPNFVGIQTTADLATITTTDYFANEKNNIEFLNNGVWQWERNDLGEITDLILIFYSPAQIGFFTFDESTQSFVSLADNGNLSNTLPSAEIFVGNASNIATPVAASGAFTLNNAGVATLGNNVVDYSNLKSDVSKLIPVSLTATDIQDMYTTPFLLIDSPGPGNVILIDDIFTDFFYGGTQFTGGGDTAAQYGNANHGAGPKASARIDNATINGLTADTCILIAGGANAVVANRTSVVNTAVYLSNNNAAYATGNSAMVLYIRYRIQAA